MITGRAWTFFVGAGVLYLFANQTQVGWLYVMSALLAGVTLAGVWLSRGMLKGFSAQRRVQVTKSTQNRAGEGEYFEGDTLTVDLELHSSRGSSQLRVTETCPLAAPGDPYRAVRMFIPGLAANGAVRFSYDVRIDRRGLHEFPAVRMETSAPFGFRQQQRDLAEPIRLLVYPEIHTLPRLDLLDRQLAPLVPRMQAGVGYEVMGVRPYRSGDSPRDIHWRSVARTGQLIVKEYADESQPGLTIALDTFAHDYPQTEEKHVPFEWAIKCAASLGVYAQSRGYPLYLTGDADVLPFPRGALTQDALLQYLARLQPTGKTRFTPKAALGAFFAAILPFPDLAVIPPLIELQHQRIAVLAVVIDPASFPQAGPSAAKCIDSLRSAGIATCPIKFGEDWAIQLAEGQSR
jgi:uncharacterized protein (DUF58 family)